MQLRQHPPKGARFQPGQRPPNKVRSDFELSLKVHRVQSSAKNRYDNPAREVASIFWVEPKT